MRSCLPRLTVVAGLAVVLMAVDAAAADAAVPVSHAAVGPLVEGSIFSKIAGEVLGAFSWTIGVASKFLLVTVAAFIRMLIPRSWAHAPIAVFDWIVAVPDFAGTVTSPSGGSVYGFGAVNDLRGLFEWVGVGFLPVTLTWSVSRSMLGTGEPVAAPVVRVLALAGGLAFYPWLWGQAAAIVDQLTNLILSLPEVTDGIRQLMAYATEGVALGGWELIDLGLMGAIALEFLGLILVKVVIVLIGAILYAVGPLMIGLAPTEAGARLTRAWAAAASALLAVPVAWAAVFATGAVLIDSATTAGGLVGGTSAVGQLLGGVIVAVAGVATLWLCLKVTREIGSLARGHLAVARPAIADLHPRASRPATIPRTVGQSRQAAGSVRGFQTRVRGSAASATAGAEPPRRSALGSAVQVGRRGLIRSSASLVGGAVSAGRRTARPRTRTDATPGRPGATRTTLPAGRTTRAGAAVAHTSPITSRAAASPQSRKQDRTPRSKRRFRNRSAATPRGAETVGRGDPVPAVRPTQNSGGARPGTDPATGSRTARRSTRPAGAAPEPERRRDPVSPPDRATTPGGPPGSPASATSLAGDASTRTGRRPRRRSRKSRGS